MSWHQREKSAAEPWRSLHRTVFGEHVDYQSGLKPLWRAIQSIRNVKLDVNVATSTQKCCTTGMTFQRQTQLELSCVYRLYLHSDLHDFFFFNIFGGALFCNSCSHCWTYPTVWTQISVFDHAPCASVYAWWLLSEFAFIWNVFYGIGHLVRSVLRFRASEAATLWLQPRTFQSFH